jgi:hypothetical protein
MLPSNECSVDASGYAIANPARRLGIEQQWVCASATVAPSTTPTTLGRHGCVQRIRGIAKRDAT